MKVNLEKRDMAIMRQVALKEAVQMGVAKGATSQQVIDVASTFYGFLLSPFIAQDEVK